MTLSVRQKVFIGASFAAFVLFAVYNNSFGADALVMMEFFKISSAEQGFILTLQSVFTMLTTFFLASAGERMNKTNVIAFGLALMSCGSLGIAAANNYAVIIGFACVCGVGITCVNVMMNGMISDVFPQKKSTILPILHAFYGLGSMAAPFFITLSVTTAAPQTYRNPYLFLFLACAALLVVFLVSCRFMRAELPYQKHLRMQSTKKLPSIFRTKNAWLFLAAGTLYFFFQIGIASWLPTYAATELGLSLSSAGLLLTAFFGGALIMRFLGPLFLKKMSAATLFSVGGLIAVFCMVVTLTCRSNMVGLVFAAASGFFQGSSVVCVVLMCCDAYPTQTAAASSVCSFASGIAYMLVPFLVGGIAEFWGFQLPLLLCCALGGVGAVLILCMNLLQKKTAARECFRQ